MCNLGERNAVGSPDPIDTTLVGIGGEMGEISPF